MELRVLGPLEVLEGGRAIAVGGGRERALLVALGVRPGGALSGDALVDALWGEHPPRSATKQLQNLVLRLRKLLGADAVRTTPLGYALGERLTVDTARFESGLRDARTAVARGSTPESVPIFVAALAAWRGRPFEELSGWAPAEGEAARLEELRRLGQEEEIDARLGCGADAECVAELWTMVTAEPLRERRWVQLMVALYRSGRQADALRVYQRARETLETELGVEPGPELQATERAVLAHDPELRVATRRVADPALPSGVVTFLLTDIEGSSRLWEEDPKAMAMAIARLDETIAAAVAASAGTLLKSKGEGDSTLSVFARATDATVAGLAVRDRLDEIDWPDGALLSVRCALHTGESVEREGDYFGPALNRAARIRALAVGGQILVSQATAELVRDHLPDDADLVELGPLPLRDLERPERVFALVEPGKPGRDVAGAVCPYPGLLAFQPEDHERFFGREALVDALVTRLAATRLVAVIGASGSGKSSLVRAGVVPRLPTEGRVMVMTPGARPLAEPATRALEATVADGTRLVVVVDQLEELFTRCADHAERRRFLDVLATAVTTPQRQTAVVVALRADFYGYCADDPVFAELVAAATVLLGPMHPDELRAAIEGPARVSGLRLESGLADLVLADVAGEPGALPLVSHVLLETWRRRRGRTLTVAGYRETGGVRGAIARTAETIYDTLTPHQQATARNVFVRLTEVGEGTDDTRRRVTIDELAPAGHTDEVSTVLGILADARLVTIGEDTVEIAHEALIGEWPRLRGWLDDDREGLRLLGQLNRAAAEWAALSQDPGALYRGVRLAAVLQWLAGVPSTELNVLEREFLDASEAAHDIELRTARRATRQLRLLAIGLGAAFLIALAAGTVAVLQRRDADRQAGRATHDATLAQATRLATLARTLPTRQLDLALLLGIEGHRLVPSVATDGGLEAALTRTPAGLERVLHFDTPSAYASVTPDGRLLAAAGTDGKVRVWDFPKGRLIRTLRGHSTNGAFVALFNPEASLVAAGGRDGKVIVWRVATGKPIGPPITPGGGTVYGLFDNTDPTRLFTVSDDGTVTPWDLRDPAHPKQIGDRFTFPVTPNDTPVGVGSPDGRLLAAGGFSAQRTAVWDVATHRLRYELPGAPGGFSPDSGVLTTTLPDRVVLWDAATGQQSGAPLTGFTSAAPATVFSPDGRRLAAGDLADNTIRVFDLASRQPIGEPLALHGAFAFPSQFLPAGQLVTTGANEAALWHPDGSAAPLETVLRGHSGGAPGTDSGAVGQFSPDGAETITIGLTDHRALAWDPNTGAPRGELLGGRIVTMYAVAFSPDGKTIAAGGLDGTYTVWDRASGRQLSSVETGQTGAVALAWDPHRPILVTSDANYSILWDVTNPRHPVQARLEARSAPGGFPYFSPDGRLLVLDSVRAATATIFDVATGHRLRVLHGGGTGMPQISFTPDSKTLAAVIGDITNTGRVVLWDTKTWHRRATLTLPYLADGIEFLNSGARFATTSFESAPSATTGRVDLWDTATLQPVGEPLTVPTPDTFLALANAHGTKIAVGSNRGVTTVLDMDPRAWQQTACDIAGRNLNHTEWAQYLPGQPYQAPCPQWPAGG